MGLARLVLVSPRSPSGVPVGPVLVGSVVGSFLSVGDLGTGVGGVVNLLLH